MRALLRSMTLAAVLALTATGPAWAVARFVYVEGDVFVRTAAGVTRAVRTGGEVGQQETVLVGEGRAQLRFDDGGWVALQRRTIFELRQYDGRADGLTVFSLLKGGARAITGLLAERQPANYRFETPNATIGIRGTSFQVTFCAQSCNVPDGLYVTGGDGTIFVRNPAGEIDLTRGRTAYVANAQTPPRESNVKPVAEAIQTVTPQTVAAASATSPGELRPGNFAYASGTGGYVGPFTTRTVSSFGLAGAISGTATGRAAGTLNGIFKSDSGSATGAGADGGATHTLNANTGSISVVLDGLQRPFSVTIVGSDGSRLSATALNVPEIAQNDGTLFWGRWSNASLNFDINDPKRAATANGSATLAPGYLHYLVGVPVGSVPVAGSATYSFSGGTGSTSQAGSVGSGVTAGTLTANFASNSEIGRASCRERV